MKMAGLLLYFKIERKCFKMKANVIEKINATNQKYLKPMLGKELPQKLVDQLNNMDWSYLDLIDHKEQARGTFAPLGAMVIFSPFLALSMAEINFSNRSFLRIKSFFCSSSASSLS